MTHSPYRTLAVVLWFGLAQMGESQPIVRLPGLVATANDGERAVVFTSPTPNFGLTRAQSIHPQLKASFNAEWKGFLKLPRDAVYVLTAGAPVFVDGKNIEAQKVPLAAGDHSFRLPYQRPPGPVRLQIWWESDYMKREPIPATAFEHATEGKELAATAQRDQGRRLWEALNCAGCHTLGPGIWRAWKGPTLSGTGSRVNRNWLFSWLQNPGHFTTNATMPSVLETPQESADVTAFLGRLKESAFPVTETLAVKNQARKNRGRELYLSIGCTACHTEEQWSLSGLGSKAPPGILARFLYDPVSLDPSGRMPGMMLSLDEASIIAEYLEESRNPEFEHIAPPGDETRGKELVQTRGCLNCHTLEKPENLTSRLAAPALDGARSFRGCLAPTPSGSVPRYRLTDEERQNLTLFLGQPDRSEAPLQDYPRALAWYGCTACHDYHAPPKVSFPRLPPPLTESGEKLRAGWLEQVFGADKRVRPWLTLRMPQFGRDNLQPLIPLLATACGAESGDGEAFPDATPEQARSGIKLIGRGEGGLSCINCHDFRGEKAAAEMRGPDMVEMRDRLRGDWVRRWLRDPARHVPGTAMPGFFTELPSIQAEPMLDLLLRALGTGANMPNPIGLPDPSQSYQLLVKDTPVLLRCLMPNSSARSIAVGLPGKQNYCFDAAGCCLRYAWRGEFLDVRSLWTERGGQPPKLLGSPYYVGSDFCLLRVGDPRDASKVKFRGYQLAQGVPTFLFEVDGVPVKERITAGTDVPGLVCAFEVGPFEGDLWLVPEPNSLSMLHCSAGPFGDGRLRIQAHRVTKFELTIAETE